MSTATINGRPVLEGRVHLPAWGIWTAVVETDLTTETTGAATIVLGDLTLKGTIVSAGVADATRTRYRVVGGAGGWGRTVAGKAYTNDLGIKRALVAGDAARDCGETMGTVTGTVGVSYVRHEGPAARVLDDVAARDWYVDELGVTQIGRRARSTVTPAPHVLTVDAARGRVDIAPELLAGLVPGVVVSGVEALDVEHTVGGDGKVRTTLWGRSLSDTLGRLVEARTEHHKYFAPWEYRVVLRSGERLDLQAVRVSSGMPDLRNVRIRPGLAGGRAHPKLGSTVLVSFVNGDPSRPVVTAFDEQDGAGWVPDEIALQAGTTGASPTEHATSAEAMVLFVYQMLLPAAAAFGGAPALALAVGTALSAIGAGTTTLATIDTAIASPAGTTRDAIASALAAKTANTTGNAPSLGWPNVRGG